MPSLVSRKGPADTKQRIYNRGTKDIIDQFIDAEEVRQKKRYFYDPDTELCSLSVCGSYFDNALFVLVETDHFDAKFAEFAIKEKFQTDSMEWWVQLSYKI